MGEPVQGAFKGIGFRFGCQFQTSPVFPYKPRPFLIDTPVRTGLCIVPVHEPDIAVDDLKGWWCLYCLLRLDRLEQKAKLYYGNYCCKMDFDLVRKIKALVSN